MWYNRGMTTTQITAIAISPTGQPLTLAQARSMVRNFGLDGVMIEDTGTPGLFLVLEPCERLRASMAGRGLNALPWQDHTSCHGSSLQFTMQEV